MKEIVILPYRKKRSHKEYLVKIEKNDNWDQHPDQCSISFIYDKNEDITDFIKKQLDELLNVNSKKDHFFNLGVCTASKNSDKIYYLYCINISKMNFTFDNNKYRFITEDELMENIDAQLIVAYSKMHFLMLN